MKQHFFSDMGVMLGRSMRHIFRSLDTIITVALTPIAMMLLFVYVLGGAIQTGTDNYVNYLLPGILLIAIASGIAYTAYRLFMDMQSGIFERFHSMPIARSAALWGHVLTSLVSNGISVVVIILVGADDGLPLAGRGTGMAGCGGNPGAVYAGADMDRGDRRTVCKKRRRRRRVCLPADLPAFYQFGVRADRLDATGRTGFRRKPAGYRDRECDTFSAGGAASRQ